MTYPIELKKDDRPGKAVQWIGADGGMKTGTRLVVADSMKPFRPYLFDVDDAIVIEHQTGEIRVLVETDLRPYPSEPIEQP